jgi:hypothetical protein
MIQESIVDYINSQMKLGVSRDAIKTTLTGAGWVAADVEDTLKKVEAAKMSSPISAMPAASAMTAAKPAEPAVTSRIITPVGGPAAAAGPEPQTIKVSDLISSTPAAKPAAAPMSKSPMTGPAAMPSTTTNMPAGIKSANTFQATSYPGMKPRGSRGALITEIVLVVIILAVGGFAGFLFMQNNSLNSQLSSLSGQSSGVNAQLSTLEAQVVASTTALTTQVSTLNSANQELQTELSFLVAPTSTTPGATSTATISGTVSAGKTSYVIMATYGTKIYIANSKAASVIAAINPLLATGGTTGVGAAASTTPVQPAATAQFTGTYTPGLDVITLTAVNGTSL